ncbi:MAG: hypothetical protein ISQ84_00610 [Pelagibacterales bacterium]|jgi:hypothetical protein|nr:hypothetical protein [Pelagibacterales bacterium]|tara:strand:+ start:7635 stop:7832 length:198 start_codon:yes stop_codon:yes gene_type:complete
MAKKYYIFLCLLISFITIIIIYFNPISSIFKEDAIIIIDSNLKEYRVIPEDKGGLPQYDLDILDE